jgi:DNA-binding PadR family transcriptional regulator
LSQAEDSSTLHRGMPANPERRTSARPGRPMTSPVYWRLLGLIIARPGYGSQLMQRYEQLYGELQPLGSYSHVYSAINALETRSLIESIRRSNDERQPKVRYRATPAGIEDYEGWLVEQVVGESRRQVLLARELGIFARSPVTMLQVLRRVEDRCLELAGEVNEAPGKRTTEAMPASAAAMEELVEERRHRGVAELLFWLREARERFEGLAAGERE